MAQQHPDNAAYVSADGKVSFDRYGRKLDSLGHVQYHDRQRAGDAGASPIERRQEEQPKGPPPEPTAARYTFPANATGQPVQRSRWDNSVVAPQGGAGGSMGSTAVNRPVRRSLQNYDTFAARSGWRAPSDWEAGNTWRGSPTSRPVDNNPVPMLDQLQSYIPPAAENRVPAPTPLGIPDFLPADAFQRAAQNWGPQGLPMPNNAQYDPYQEQQFSVYPLKRTYNGFGLPVPNNQVFDPYMP